MIQFLNICNQLDLTKSNRKTTFYQLSSLLNPFVYFVPFVV
jgi:hypothetical protein